jgi:uncharacterized protein (DUF924 family)
MTPLSGKILEFWIGPPTNATRAEWFRKQPAFDAAIRARFGDALEAALAGTMHVPDDDVRDSLAHVVLLDQFTRNAFRDTPRAFAGDRQALRTSIAVVDADRDATLDHFERWFLYMPFQHAEDPAMQQRSIALFTRLADEAADPALLGWAGKHAAIIRRFGRYPHRNAILGRASTPEEIAFLSEPGSRF